MNRSEIKDFLSRDLTKTPSSPELLALWYDGKGNWEKAHDQVDQLASKDAARIHAYLHRKEGDEWNAAYWYQRAGVPIYEGTLDAEWEELVEQFWIYD